MIKLLKFIPISILFLMVVPVWGKAIKISHGPYLQNVYEKEATIVWVSNKPSIAWVELAPNDSTNFYSFDRQKIYDTTIGIKRVSFVHSVRLKGLVPGMTYRYRVYSKEVLTHQGLWGYCCNKCLYR